MERKRIAEETVELALELAALKELATTTVQFWKFPKLGNFQTWKSAKTESLPKSSMIPCAIAEFWMNAASQCQIFESDCCLVCCAGYSFSCVPRCVWPCAMPSMGMDGI